MTTELLPFSQACENNKGSILEILKEHLAGTESVMEIAAGTGQHGVYFSQQMPGVCWQVTDVPANVDILNKRIIAANRSNLPLAKKLDVSDRNWPGQGTQVIFTANSLHIMPASAVVQFFSGVKKILAINGLLFVYGPFKYQGDFTTESNARFDLWLKQQNGLSGVRDFETVMSLAADSGLGLLADNKLPANNQLLVFRRLTTVS